MWYASLREGRSRHCGCKIQSVVPEE
jgi:hypothetical protein